MPGRSSSSQPAFGVGDAGGTLLLAAAAAVTAAILMTATLMPASGGPVGGPEPAPVVTEATLPAGWTEPAARSGKFGERLSDAVAPAGSHEDNPLLLPAAIAMPMLASWPEPGAATRERLPGETVVLAASSPPVRKPAPQPVRARPAVEAARSAPEAPSVAVVPWLSEEQRLAAGRERASPIGRVGAAMSDAVGTVGAAGIWTLSQASSLLPRP